MNEEGGAGRQGVHEAGGTGRQDQGQDRADPNSEGEGARRQGESDAKSAEHRSTHEDEGGRRRAASDTSSSQDNAKGENEALGAGRQGVYKARGRESELLLEVFSSEFGENSAKPSVKSP